jgi:hypothetical protein
MKRLLALAVILSMSFLCSCFYIRVDYPWEEGGKPIADFHKVVPFEPGGTLSLENASGDLEIRGWEKDEMDVYARKMIHWPNRTRIYVYPWNDFTPGIVFDQFENFVKIKTKSVSEDKDADVVHFSIDVPRSISLKDIVVGSGSIMISEVYGEVNLDLVNGDIVLESFSGSLSASVIKGSVTTALYDLREQDEILITCREGDITLSLQDDVQAHLEAIFPNGEIASDFEIEDPYDKKEIEMQLGEGGAFISLSALNGNIRINRIKTD